MVRCLPLAVWLISASALAGPDAILRVEDAPGVSCGLPLSVRCSAEDLARLAGPDARTPLAATAARCRKFDSMRYIGTAPRAKKGSVGPPQPLWRRARAVSKFFSGKFRKIP